MKMVMPGGGWIRRVLDGGAPVTGPAADPADHLLLEKLGAETPEQSYLGPIESGGAVIALLYADQAATGSPMPDSRALEVVLRHAGLALARCLELWCGKRTRAALSDSDRARAACAQSESSPWLTHARKPCVFGGFRCAGVS